MKNEIEIKKHIKNISDITNNQYDIQIQVILDYYKNNIKCNIYKSFSDLFKEVLTKVVNETAFINNIIYEENYKILSLYLELTLDEYMEVQTEIDNISSDHISKKSDYLREELEKLFNNDESN